MKKTVNIINIILVLSFLVSCSPKIMTEPYYTTVKKMYDLEPGMKLNKVNEILGIKPYNFYFNTKNGNSVYVYKYKHAYHTLSGYSTPEEALMRGEPRYKEANNVFIEFDQKTNSLVGFHTDKGEQKALEIMKHENTLNLVINDYSNYERFINNKSNLDAQISENKQITRNTNNVRQKWDVEDIDYIDNESYVLIADLSVKELRYYKYSTIKKIIVNSGLKPKEISKSLGRYKKARNIGNILTYTGYLALPVFAVRGITHGIAKHKVKKHRKKSNTL